ncbi:MAG TPA: sugar ABC transporter permease [Candidatus Ornithomonoglobus intestinigallinarum]|uniref:Sugar ABC transporter permease n=1 Tax=Candidatus Ornithomonoglobus intestinigallinarum TaxID=2840894 RepID=A0A9D1H4I1_9FIRM|nr:sugar ABC transporter permease [Candidatus Ornithomonoglobus intestinigallinarum]
MKSKRNAALKKPDRNLFVYWLKKDGPAWLILMPFLITGIIFCWEPLLSGIRISFFDTRGFETTEFIGLQNYKDVITDSVFLTAMANTFKYTLWSIVLGLFTPVFISLVLNELVHGKAFFRFATYFPCIVPGVVTSVMWLLMFYPGDGGILNYIRSFMGLPALQWLNDPSMTIMLIVITMTWGGAGSTAILYLADLQSVNTDLYEAVSLDGGGIWRKFIHITLPHMSGMIKMMFVMQIISVFQVFQQPLTMTGGGPNNASITLAMVSYDYAFATVEMGKSTATSVIMALMLLVFTVLYMRIKSHSMDE